MTRGMAMIVVLVAIGAAAGCSANDPLNPSFPLLLVDAKAELKRMTESPKPFDRPVIVAGGIYDPGLVAGGIARQMRKLGGTDAPVMTISFFGVGSFEGCRERIVAEVQERFPGDDPAETVEVDVIAFSMGGLVARYAAVPRDDSPRLRIGRLFTIATPHRGAKAAGLPSFDVRVKEMRAGAEFLERLDDELAAADYELYTYTRLGDSIVGEHNTAPPGRIPWWVANDPFSFAHLGAGDDERIIADIAARLRGETPFATSPPEPPPGWPVEDDGPEAVAEGEVPVAGGDGEPGS